MSGNQIAGKAFYVTVKALLYYNEKFLIVRRSKMSQNEYGFWEFPGGRLEFSEDPKEGLLREIKEEVDIDATIKFPISVWDHVKTDDHIIGITFLAEAHSDNINLSDEHNDYKWIDKDEFENYKVFPKIIEESKEWNWDNIYNAIKKQIIYKRNSS